MLIRVSDSIGTGFSDYKCALKSRFLHFLTEVLSSALLAHAKVTDAMVGYGWLQDATISFCVNGTF